jgi:hypothetical protein
MTRKKVWQYLRKIQLSQECTLRAITDAQDQVDPDLMANALRAISALKKDPATFMESSLRVQFEEVEETYRQTLGWCTGRGSVSGNQLITGMRCCNRLMKEFKS